MAKTRVRVRAIKWLKSLMDIWLQVENVSMDLVASFGTLFPVFSNGLHFCCS